MMTEEQYSQLRDDIKEHGQCEDVVVWKGLLLDGRNRLRACEELGIEPQIAELMEETDPVAYVISHNLHRRHLTTAQRAMVATKLATLRDGEKKEGAQICAPSQTEAAETLNVSRRSVQKAKTVSTKATPEVVAAVEAGTMSLNAAEATTKPKASQAEKAAAKAAKEQAKAEAVAAKALAKAEAAGVRQKIKDDAAEDKAEAKAAKEAAKIAALTIEGQAKNIANLIQQYIDKAVRAVDDLNFVKPNPVACKAAVKLLQGVKLW